MCSNLSSKTRHSSEIRQCQHERLRANENGVDVLDVNEIELRRTKLERRVQVDSVVELLELFVDDAAARVSIIRHALEPLILYQCLRQEVLERTQVQRAVEH